MGINLKNKDWYPIVQKHREERKCLCQHSDNRGKFCAFHGWALSGGFLNNIHTTPAANAFINTHKTKYDENEKALASTQRGKRRREHRGSK